MIRRVAIAVLFIWGTVSLASPLGPGAAELEYGYFCALEPVATQSASGTVSGTVNIVDGSPDFIGPGPQVPGQLGIGFGVKVRPDPRMSGPVTVEVAHPPMGPNAVTRQHWNTTLDGTGTQYLGYTFERDYEVLPGQWTMSASSNGRPVYSVSFTVVDPARMPWVDCGRQVPLS